MTVTTFYALMLLIALYVGLRICSHKPHKLYQTLINRTGKRLANQLIRDTHKNYPQRSRLWVIKKVLADLDRGLL